MAERLYRPFPMDLRSDKTSFINVTPVKYAGDGELRTFYMSDYFASAYKHTDAPNGGKMPEYDSQVLRAYHAIASDPKLYLDMEFEPGDIQLLNNHVVLHARTAFEDSEKEKRHLLRLWLTLERDDEPWRQALSRKIEAVMLIGTIVWSKIRFKIWGSKTR